MVRTIMITVGLRRKEVSIGVNSPRLEDLGMGRRGCRTRRAPLKVMQVIRAHIRIVQANPYGSSTRSGVK